MPNLLNENDVLKLCKTTSIFVGMNSNDVITTLKIFSDLDVPCDLLNFNDAGLITFNEHGLQRKIAIIDIFKLAKKLVALKQCKGFSTLSKGLNNQTQFCDTMFEVDCIYLMFINPHVIEVEVSPEVLVNGRIKRPDFRFLVRDGLDLICECKSIASAHRIKNSRVLLLIKQLRRYLASIITENLRRYIFQSVTY